MPFNPLDYPGTFLEPRRLSPSSAWITHIPFASCLIAMLQPRTIVELGVHQGDSYCAFCQTIESLKLSTKCYGVDTWKGDAHAGFYPEQVLAQLRAHHDPLYKSFSTLIQADFDRAVTQFDPGSIDLLHIDGFHTYDAVRHDYETWRSKASDRGVIIFHDTEVRHKDFGVWKFWAEVSSKYPNFNFLHGAGLGILAVGRSVPRAVLDFLETANANADAVRQFYCQLGQQVERQRLARMLVMQVHQARVLVNAWKKQSGHEVSAQSMEAGPIYANPMNAMRELAVDISMLMKAKAAVAV